MFDKGWMAMKATLAFPPLLLCAVSYVIFHDEFFGQYISASLLVCFCFLFPCFMFILGGMCGIKRKPYAENRLFEELRDCDLETENEIEIKPLDQHISNLIQQFFMNIYSLCVYRPLYGIMFSVGFFVLSAICCFLVGIEDPKLKADVNFACMQLIAPALLLIAVVIFLANSGIYTSTPSCELQSYHPFQESVEIPVSVLFGRTFAAVVKLGRLNIFYALLLFVYVMVAVHFLDQIKDSPENTVEEWQTRSNVPSIQFLISALAVLSTASGFFILVQLILSAYVEAKQCTLAIIEKNWRRNIRAIGYLLKASLSSTSVHDFACNGTEESERTPYPESTPQESITPEQQSQTQETNGVTYESLEDLQAALDAKRIKELSDHEIVAFDYIAIPLWQTRRPFVDRTPPPQENADLSRGDLEHVEESLLKIDSADVSVQEQVENPEENIRTDDQKEEGTSPSTSAANVTRRHTRQLSIVNVQIKPAKITRRRQEVPIPEEVPEEEEIPQDSDDNKDVPEDESSGTTTHQEGSSKTEPTRGVTYESLEDLQAALEAKRIKALSDHEIVAFDYIAMPLWQTRRPFVDMTQDGPPRQENADLAPENLETVEESVQEQEENPEDNTCTDDQKAEGTSPSTSAAKVTRRHTRQLSIVNVEIKPAKITRRRQEVPIPEEVPEEIPLDSDDNDVPEDESSGTTTHQEGSSKPEPTRVTRRREYYD